MASEEDKSTSRSVDIIRLLGSTDGQPRFIEFEEDGRTKILSKENFERRYGDYTRKTSADKAEAKRRISNHNK